jgi:predicted XRE-type DNA-binding protein
MKNEHDMGEDSREWRDMRSEVVHDEREVAASRRRVLSQLRRRRDLTQKVVAEQMGVSQSRVSAIESGDVSATELRTLASYISALGGKLKVVADFGDHQLRLD